MDVKIKSVGILIDDLITTSMKLWHLQDEVQQDDPSDERVAQIFRTIQTLNVRRNKLINALDDVLDENVFSTSEKNYK